MMFWLSDNKAWFRPKTFGLGAGLPIAWQGWAFLALHILLITGIAIGLRNHVLAMTAAVLTAALLPLPIYAAKTEGGWRWRWGNGK